ncbi:MAG: tetratricopeptide repeat protein, partial [Dissulfurispiraceae bacterium]
FDLTVHIGSLYLEENEFDKARQLYAALPRESHGAELYYGVTKGLIEKEKYEEARLLLEDALSKYLEDWELTNSMGLVFQRTNDYYEALRYFDRALAIANTNPASLLYNKALSLNCLGYHEEAFKVLTELLAKVPDDPEYLLEMGYCHLQRKESSAAIHYYRAAKGKGLESGSVYGGLCCAYVEAGLHHDAYLIARDGVQKNPGDIAMYENLAEAALDLGYLEEAKDVIQQGFELDHGYEPLKKLQLRIAHETSGDREKQQEYFDEYDEANYLVGNQRYMTEDQKINEILNKEMTHSEWAESMGMTEAELDKLIADGKKAKAAGDKMRVSGDTSSFPKFPPLSPAGETTITFMKKKK